MYDKFVFVGPGSDYGHAMWSDLEKVSNCHYFDNAIITKNKFLKTLHHIHYSFAINARIDLPLKSVWDHFFATSSINYDPTKKYCIIFTDISACRTDVAHLRNLYSAENIDLAIIHVNTFSQKQKLLMKRDAYFKYKFSFDKNDCAENGFEFFPTNYSVQKLEKKQTNSDAFFIGVDKGNRLDKLQKLNKLMQQNGLQSAFYISKVDGNYNDGIIYNEWCSYKSILDKISETNCIVEIMGGNQSGLTLRAMEAIVYNKRLLTDNKTVVDLPFYKSGFIKIMEEPCQEDIEFIKDKTPVEYNYNGEFSPVRLLNKINELSDK